MSATAGISYIAMFQSTRLREARLFALKTCPSLPAFQSTRLREARLSLLLTAASGTQFQSTRLREARLRYYNLLKNKGKT